MRFGGRCIRSLSWLLLAGCNAIIGNAYVDPTAGGDAESSTLDAATDARGSGADAATGDEHGEPEASGAPDASVELDASEGPDATTAGDDGAIGRPADAATSPPPDAGSQPVLDGGGSACDPSAGFGVCAGACVDLENDPQNCGNCGHSCRGGTCQFGECPVMVLGSGTDNTALTVDSSGVYWADLARQVIYQCGLGGCGQSPTVVSTVTPDARVVLDATNLYFANGTGILGCAKTGCGASPITLATASQMVVDLAVGGGNVFFSTSDGSVWACPTAGCAGGPTLLAADQGSSPEHLVSDGTNVYWVNPDFTQLLYCSVRGCAQNPTVLSSTPGADLGGVTIAGAFAALALTPSALYVLISDSDRGYIGRLPLTGSAQSPTLVVPNLSKPVSFAVDSTGIYFRDDDLGIGRTNLDGTGLTTFAFVDPVRAAAADIAIDPTGVYWISKTGVDQIAK